MLNLVQIEAFLAVADEGSVGEAAKALGRPQPTVSHQLKNLEADLGAMLFHRQMGGGLTAEGARLYPLAKRLLTMAAAARESVLAGYGRVAAATNIGTYVLQPLLKKYQDEGAGSEVISLTMASNPEVLERLSEGECEVALTEWWDKRPGFTAVPWYKEPLAVIVPPDHGWAAQESIAPEKLAREPMIGGEPGTGTGRLLRAALRRLPSDIKVDLNLGSTEAVKQAVKAGRGISIVGLNAVREEVASGSLCALKLRGRALSKIYHAVWPEHMTPASPAFGFAQFLIREGQRRAA